MGLLIGVPSALVAIATLAGAFDGSDPPAGPQRASDLRPVGVVVRDVGKGPRPRPHLEITLHNVGTGRAVISGARFRIRRVFELRRCASQGDIPLSETYGAVFPAGAEEGDLVRVPLHQQVGPDEADRFAITLSVRWPRGRPTGTIYVFDVGLVLETDEAEGALTLGRFLISLPTYPAAGQYYWTPGTADVIRGILTGSPGYAAELRRYSLPCWYANTATLREALETKWVRSSHLAALADQLVPPDPSVIR